MNTAQKREAERLIQTLTKAEVRSHFTTDFGREHDLGGVSVIVPADKAKDLVLKLRGVLPHEMLAFVGTHQWLGKEKFKGVEVVVIAGKSQFDILRLMRSNGANYDLATEDIVAKLVQYDSAFGIRIFHAETDVVEFDLLRTPGDMTAFANDVYVFCPDIVDQGVGDVKKLAEAIEAEGTVYLWWD
jgi:hypothetical protein